MPSRVPDGPVSVEFDDVRFAYPSADKVSLASLEEVATLDTRGGAEVLHGVSFRVEPGQLVALVGTSGSGKSTIASLMPRLYDVDAGAVRLSGIDVRDLTFDSIRDTLGMVTQDGHLFHDTVRENLLFARPDATDDELWDALRQARLGDLIASLPDGLDTVVGERGYRLSGGERQRLTIARLLLARPRVVILDEATAHLDSTSEAEVQAALAGALAGPDGARHRPPPVDDPRRGRDPRRRGRRGSSSAAPTPSCSPPAVATPSSTGPSSRTTPGVGRRLTAAPLRALARRRPDHPALGHDRGDEVGGRDVEGEVQRPRAAPGPSGRRRCRAPPARRGPRSRCCHPTVSPGRAWTPAPPRRTAHPPAPPRARAGRSRSCWRCRRWRRSGRRRRRPRRRAHGRSRSARRSRRRSGGRCRAAFSSNAVSREPCSSGRVSSAVTERRFPRSCSTRTMPERGAPLDARQCTRCCSGCGRAWAMWSVSCSSRSAPRSARARLARTSSSPIATASATTAAAPFVEPTDDPPDGPRQVHRGRPGCGDPLGLDAHVRRSGALPARRGGRRWRRRTRRRHRVPGAPRTASRRMSVDHRVDVADLHVHDLVRAAASGREGRRGRSRHSIVRIDPDRRIAACPRRARGAGGGPRGLPAHGRRRARHRLGRQHQRPRRRRPLRRQRGRRALRRAGPGRPSRRRRPRRFVGRSAGADQRDRAPHRADGRAPRRRARSFTPTRATPPRSPWPASTSRSSATRASRPVPSGSSSPTTRRPEPPDWRSTCSARWSSNREPRRPARQPRRRRDRSRSRHRLRRRPVGRVDRRDLPSRPHT